MSFIIPKILIEFYIKKKLLIFLFYSLIMAGLIEKSNKDNGYKPDLKLNESIFKL